jgi:hypothetical protein
VEAEEMMVSFQLEGVGVRIEIEVLILSTDQLTFCTLKQHFSEIFYPNIRTLQEEFLLAVGR